MKRAAEENLSLLPSQIIRDGLRQVKEDVVAEIPERENLRKLISRMRQRNLPPNPTLMNDLGKIPMPYATTSIGERFLLYNSLNDDDHDPESGRIIIFASTQKLIMLFQSDVWTMDGTFKAAPTLFFQLFSILGTVDEIGQGGKAQTIGLPLVYPLLESKQQAAYIKVLNVILREGRSLGLISLPYKILSDFEMAIINAANEVFGEDIASGCFFHLRQSVYRNIVDEGLKELYKVDDRLRQAAGALCALTVTPADDVATNFGAIYDDLPEDLLPIADSFRNTYIYRLVTIHREGGLIISRRPPRYSPKFWSHYDSVVDGTARTNNLSESWHKRFHLMVGKQHPRLYVFLDELKKEQDDTETMIVQLRLGQRIRRGPSRKRLRTERRLSAIAQQYNDTKTVVMF